MATTPLQLDAYIIDTLEVEALPDFDQTRQGIGLNMDVKHEHLTCDADPLAHQLILTVPFEPAEGGSAPYRGRIVGRGFFRVTEDLGAEQTAQYVIVNASAILFGLLRAQVAQVTALGRWGTFLLPPVNLHVALSKAAEDDQ
ncbi:MAG: hypothetical protein ACOX8V_01195 [Thermoleophilia bacterium]|jgi:preprotein translocase subunit SecB